MSVLLKLSGLFVSCSRKLVVVKSRTTFHPLLRSQDFAKIKYASCNNYSTSQKMAPTTFKDESMDENSKLMLVLVEHLHRFGTVQFHVIIPVINKLKLEKKFNSENAAILLSMLSENCDQVFKKLKTNLLVTVRDNTPNKNVKFYNSYISAVSSLGLQTCDAILSEMEKNVVEPTEETFNKLICLCCSQNDMETASDLISHITKEGMKFSAESISFLGQRKALQKDYEGASLIANNLIKQKLGNWSSISRIACALINEGCIDNGCEIIRSYKNASLQNMDADTFTNILQALGMQDLEAAEQFFIDYFNYSKSSDKIRILIRIDYKGHHKVLRTFSKNHLHQHLIKEKFVQYVFISKYLFDVVKTAKDIDTILDAVAFCQQFSDQVYSMCLMALLQENSAFVDEFTLASASTFESDKFQNLLRLANKKDKSMQESLQFCFDEEELCPKKIAEVLLTKEVTHEALYQGFQAIDYELKKRKPDCDKAKIFEEILKEFSSHGYGQACKLAMHYNENKRNGSTVTNLTKDILTKVFCDADHKSVKMSWDDVSKAPSESINGLAKIMFWYFVKKGEVSEMMEILRSYDIHFDMISVPLPSDLKALSNIQPVLLQQLMKFHQKKTAILIMYFSLLKAGHSQEASAFLKQHWHLVSGPDELTKFLEKWTPTVPQTVCETIFPVLLNHLQNTELVQNNQNRVFKALNSYPDLMKKLAVNHSDLLNTLEKRQVASTYLSELQIPPKHLLSKEDSYNLLVKIFQTPFALKQISIQEVATFEVEIAKNNLLGYILTRIDSDDYERVLEKINKLCPMFDPLKQSIVLMDQIQKLLQDNKIMDAIKYTKINLHPVNMENFKFWEKVLLAISKKAFFLKQTKVFPALSHISTNKRLMWPVQGYQLYLMLNTDKLSCRGFYQSKLSMSHLVKVLKIEKDIAATEKLLDLIGNNEKLKMLLTAALVTNNWCLDIAKSLCGKFNSGQQTAVLSLVRQMHFDVESVEEVNGAATEVFPNLAVVNRLLLDNFKFLSPHERIKLNSYISKQLIKNPKLFQELDLPSQLSYTYIKTLA